MSATIPSSVVVFQALSQTQAPSAAVLEELKQQSGFQRAFFGVKMEEPETGILCTEWSSVAKAARGLYCSSSLGAHETLAFAVPQAWSSVLSGPCTEVFTAFGAEDGFVENVRRFVGAVDDNPPEGYRGAAVGEGVGLTDGDGNGNGNRGGENEKLVRMVIGWTSREAHLEAKGQPGAIQDNIHELRVLRKAIDLFHVKFKAL
ncbi:hypothetical protein N657DRAFT_638629 [Parathielavia appendiculata]|uniref:ABM domain-containing protein n=1 Tax=Parathielavia appendiculata TaxID=2587402 RepID=A0AAN6U833_9PEZI|nr:hypothetical protein N657DRAFT_638629 [Parathielavia appendiculata]